MFQLAFAQAPDPGNYSAAKYELHERRGVMVLMRDGVRLALDMYVPERSENLPIVLTITPYGRTNFYTKARWFAQRGYVFVAADSRGRFDSDGTWDPFSQRHKTDGYDLVEWLAKQPWSNGRVGMCGVLHIWDTTNGGPPAWLPLGSATILSHIVFWNSGLGPGSHAACSSCLSGFNSKSIFR